MEKKYSIRTTSNEIAILLSGAGALAIASGKLELASTLFIFSGFSLAKTAYVDRLRGTRTRKESSMRDNKDKYAGLHPAPTKIEYENFLSDEYGNGKQKTLTPEEFATTVEGQVQQKLSTQSPPETHAQFLKDLAEKNQRNKTPVETMEVKQVKAEPSQGVAEKLPEAGD